jgi:outer membrane receptor protein involved in Fe transport
MHRRRSLFPILAALTVLPAGVSGARAGQATTFALAINSQPLAVALQELARQSGIEIIFFSKLTDGHVAPAVQGNVTIDYALHHLLDGTHLTYRRLNASVIEIRSPDLPSGAPDPAADPPRTRTLAVSNTSMLPASSSVAAPLAAATSARGVSAGGSTSDPAAAGIARLQEVIVTATRRQTLLQNTPISMSAVTGSTLASRGIMDLASLTSLVPGLTFNNGGPTATRLIIRGIDSAGEPMVGLYYDQTPIPGAVGSGNDSGGSTPLVPLFDVQRVEVLRGPQGTLYGSGSMGGTVRVLFNQPDSAKEAAFDADAVTTDGGRPGYDTEGMINVPLVSDVLAARAVAWSQQVGGYIDNTLLHQTDVNDYHEEGGRLMLRYKPFRNLTLDGWYLYESIDGGQPIWMPAYGSYNTRSQTLLPFFDRFQIADLTARWDISQSVQATAIFSDFKRTTATAGSVSSFIESYYNNAGDCAFFTNGGPPCSPAQQTGFNDFVAGRFPSDLYDLQHVATPQAEVRVSSVGDHFIDWTVGGFYSNRATHANNSEVDANAATGVVLINDQAEYVYTRLIYDRLKQVAGYGQASAHLTKKLTLTFGLRDASYTREAAGATPIGLDLVGASVTPWANTVSFTQKVNVTNTNLSYQFTKNLMVYAGASQGFRPGGVNQVTGLPSAFTPYKSDSLWDYEVGEKSSWFDRRLTFNFDGYLIDWTNMQVSGLTPNGAFSFITNAGAARATGLELDLAALPIEHLELHADFSLSHAYLTASQVNPNVTGPGVAGNTIPFAPRYQGSLGAEYTVPLTQVFAGTVRLDESYVGESYSELNDSDGFDTELPAYALTNLRLGLLNVNSDWSVSLYADNIFNKVGLVTSANSALQPTTEVASVPPRTIGVNFRMKFMY